MNVQAPLLVVAFVVFFVSFFLALSSQSPLCVAASLGSLLCRFCACVLASLAWLSSFGFAFFRLHASDPRLFKKS
jgi:hypothetical protein